MNLTQDLQDKLKKTQEELEKLRYWMIDPDLGNFTDSVKRLAAADKVNQGLATLEDRDVNEWYYLTQQLILEALKAESEGNIETFKRNIIDAGAMLCLWLEFGKNNIYKKNLNKGGTYGLLKKEI